VQEVKTILKCSFRLALKFPFFTDCLSIHASSTFLDLLILLSYHLDFEFDISKKGYLFSLTIARPR